MVRRLSNASHLVTVTVLAEHHVSSVATQWLLRLGASLQLTMMSFSFRGTSARSLLHSHFVAGILYLRASYKVLFDASHAHKSCQQILTASFVVGAA